MHILILTNEYPPNVYGGAGVHVEYLTRELAALGGEAQVEGVRVLCFGTGHRHEGRLTVDGVEAPVDLHTQDDRHDRFFDTALRNLVMAGMRGPVDVVHCHTWYTHLAGCLVKHLRGVPLVLTTHSLEPHRPWKAEQLGTAYQASTFVERTAYQNADGVVAVSDAMRQDVHDLYGVSPERIRVIHNGVDLNVYRPSPDREVLARYGIGTDRPFVLFVGRITRQKGIIHLVRALRYVRADVQIVLCAGAADTPEIDREMTEAIGRARASTANPIIWIRERLPRADTVALYSQAGVFVCPSVYEPFGIINLEAMACETPVVASAVGGIPEVVAHGETGLLVPIEPQSDTDVEPRDPDRFARDLATAIDTLMSSPDDRASMGRRARARVDAEFGWPAVARQTATFYADLIAAHRRPPAG